MLGHITHILPCKVDSTKAGVLKNVIIIIKKNLIFGY